MPKGYIKAMMIILSMAPFLAAMISQGVSHEAQYLVVAIFFHAAWQAVD